MGAVTEFLKRWGPLVGTAFVSGIVLLKAIGQESVAKVVETIGGMTGVIGQTDVTGAEVLAGVAAVSGVVLKVIAQWKKAKAGV